MQGYEKVEPCPYGDPNEPPNIEEARKLIKEAGVEAIAVCFLFSFLNDEHEQLRDSIRRFAETELAPHAEEWEETTFPDWVFKRAGELGIIPGSMGARSFIVRGKGNPQSLCSCAHGAGRLMSRTEAKKRFTAADVERQTAGVECRKDAGVVDEIPGAYKPIDEVMENQSDLVEVVHTLKQVLCVKG